MMRELVSKRVSGFDPRELGGEYSVVALCIVALTVAISTVLIETVTSLALALLIAATGGVALAVAVRLLAADRTTAMPVGGALAPVGSVVVFGAPVLGFIQSGVMGAGIAICGAIIGFGCGLIVGQVFDRNRPYRAASRHLVASMAVGLVSIFGVFAFTGQADPLIAASAWVWSTLGEVIWATSRPTVAAGPTLLFTGTGLYAAARTLARLSVPSILTTETQEIVRAIVERWERVSRLAGLGALVGGGILVAMDVSGSVTTALTAVPPARVFITALGGAIPRSVAIVAACVGVASYLTAVLGQWVQSLTVQRVAEATLPTVGIVTGAIVVGVAFAIGPVVELGSLPGVGAALAETDVDPIALAAMVAVSLVLTSTGLVTGSYVLCHLIGGRIPGVKLMAVGVAGTGFVILATTSSAVTGFILLALAMFVTDMGAFGWTVGSEVGRRGGGHAELIHGLASALVGGFGVILALLLVDVATTGGQNLSPLHFAVGAAAVAVVFLTIGRQLSTR